MRWSNVAYLGGGYRLMQPTHTVLFVDDSPVVRRALARRLEAEGFSTCEVGSIAAARSADTAGVACAIVDLELADGDGPDLAAFLVARRALPVAFFTSGGTPSLLERARGYGPVFLKPGLDGVVAWVKRAMRPSQPPPTK